jgi:large-conductance mechanosensitive channel
MKIDFNRIKAFIHKHSLASVAIGFIVAHSGSRFLQAVIEGLLMPLFNPLLNGVDWKVHTLKLGVFSFAWGPVVAAALHLISVLLIVVAVIRMLEYEEPLE